MKLNLGCDNKLLEDWVNVDIHEPKFVKTDIVFVKDDVCKLEAFKDNSADTIRAYHLLEHLKYPDARGFLKACYRVLKEGGMLELEMPCLLKCSTNFIKISDKIVEEVERTSLVTTPKEILRKLDATSVRGFYGLQDTRDEMSHRYGWSFLTLEAELREIGFKDIREEDPTTKIRARDFRCVAFK
jgi:ubiquinone/menaquinone biosynthesis C-methylase UbiE